MADIRISRLYLINNMSKSGMQYIIFHIFWVKDLNLTLRNVIDALCKEIIIHHQTVTIATDKHDYIPRIHTSILHHMTLIHITVRYTSFSHLCSINTLMEIFVT